MVLGGPESAQPYDQEADADGDAGVIDRDGVKAVPETAHYSTLDQSPGVTAAPHAGRRWPASSSEQRRNAGHRPPTERGSSRGSRLLSRRQERWSVRWPH